MKIVTPSIRDDSMTGIISALAASSNVNLKI
jgi:hypothetical protein